ncbi:MAG: triose-phosphate isomerase [Pseudomonadota bacterium]|nr:triose-phosphate isomerase [Pseudomonadota bacterium]
MKKLIVANWKMNKTKVSGISLVKSLSAKINRSNRSSREVVVCPPFTLISEISKILKSSKISLGGQDCSADSFGAFTGDISPLMLKDLGCKYVIVGHSERREHHNESEKIIKNKLDLALSLGLKVILCVGEKMQERKKGNTIRIITRQLQLSISKKCNNKNTIIAYEPVWSIGSGVTPKDSEICDVHNFIKNKSSQLSIGDKPFMVLYGGSVNPGNSKNILSLQNVDGALVGGSSLKLKSFLDIIRS